MYEHVLMKHYPKFDMLKVAPRKSRSLIEKVHVKPWGCIPCKHFTDISSWDTNGFRSGGRRRHLDKTTFVDKTKIGKFVLDLYFLVFYVQIINH